MSLIDDIFGSIPGPLIDQWGIDGFYIKSSDSKQVYDPETGTFDTPVIGDQRIAIKLVPLRIKPEEINGEIQLTDSKFLIAGSSLGNYFPKVDDQIEYNQAEFTLFLKVVQPLTHRGSLPVFHSIIARTTIAIDNTDPTQMPDRVQPVMETRVDTSLQGVIYVGRAAYRTTESMSNWIVTRTTYNSSGQRLTRGTATGIAWTSRASATYS